MQIVLVAAVVAGCALFAYATGRGQAEDTARRQVTATAAAVAGSPSVRDAVGSADPSAALQPYAERVRRDAGVTFVTIMDPRGTRWTHPDAARIGQEFLGHTEPALRGKAFSETYTGTLGPSVRAVAPIRSGARITGLVSVGITVDEISAEVRRQVMALLGVALGALALGGVGTYIVNARLRRHTHGMNAAELSRMHDYHQAALHAVREGLVMLDGERRIALINDGARDLLGLTPGAVGLHVTDLGLPAPLTETLLAAGPCVDELHLTADRIVVVNTSPVSGGERSGTVVTLRDHTELQALSGELDSVRGFTEALRSQAHEAANRLHAVVSLIELGRADEAVDFATAELELAQALTDQVVAAVAEPVLAALLLGKAAQANEHGVELTLTPDSHIDDGVLPTGLPARDLVTILGNLIDNAVDASSAAPQLPGLGAPGDLTSGLRPGGDAATAAEGLAGGAPAPASGLRTGVGAATAAEGVAGGAPAPASGLRPGDGAATAAEGAPGEPPAPFSGPGPAPGAAHGSATPAPASGLRPEAGAAAAAGDGGGTPAPVSGLRPEVGEATGAQGVAGEPPAPSSGPRPVPCAAHGSETPARASGLRPGDGATTAAVSLAGEPPAPFSGPGPAPSAAHGGGTPAPAFGLRPEERAAFGPGGGGGVACAGERGAAGAGERRCVTVMVKAEGGELLVRVADTGPGIDPGAVEEVFRRGWSTKAPGRGLGLALVRQAARRNGGDVSVAPASAAGGAQFTVSLPLRGGAVAAGPAGPVGARR
ncbi:ATP-binding protein [Streptomyces varsoviensis]|uniref:ATP-binding protein n=1 Tax=Streptomyces varsoviensis TaxID=67373 RepID=UPI001FE12D98|nr:ATP-binding protein [Streptomyces varsoviensis]